MASTAPAVRLPEGVEPIARDLFRDLETVGLWDLGYPWLAFKLWQLRDCVELEWWPQHLLDSDRYHSYVWAIAAASLPGGVLHRGALEVKSILEQADKALQYEGAGLLWRDEDEGSLPDQRRVTLWVPDRECAWTFSNSFGLIQGVNSLLASTRRSHRFVGLKPGRIQHLHCFVLARPDIQAKLEACPRFLIASDEDPLAGPYESPGIG